MYVFNKTQSLVDNIRGDGQVTQSPTRLLTLLMNYNQYTDKQVKISLRRAYVRFIAFEPMIAVRTTVVRLRV